MILHPWKDWRRPAEERPKRYRETGSSKARMTNGEFRKNDEIRMTKLRCGATIEGSGFCHGSGQPHQAIKLSMYIGRGVVRHDHFVADRYIGCERRPIREVGRSQHDIGCPRC